MILLLHASAPFLTADVSGVGELKNRHGKSDRRRTGGKKKARPTRVGKAPRPFVHLARAGALRLNDSDS